MRTTSYNAGYIQDVIIEQQLNEEEEEEESRIEGEPPHLTATVQLRSVKKERQESRSSERLNDRKIHFCCSPLAVFCVVNS